MGKLFITEIDPSDWRLGITVGLRGDWGKHEAAFRRAEALYKEAKSPDSDLRNIWGMAVATYAEANKLGLTKRIPTLHIKINLLPLRMKAAIPLWRSKK